ncbi:centrosomal protein of 290 kDa-like [Hetaerina americana]|uniref:centrosomal protein of 290 kDa-like n=1 Tax=Hetaerina americana TaxID=62018 RepID=UPI003A7F447F
MSSTTGYFPRGFKDSGMCKCADEELDSSIKNPLPKAVANEMLDGISMKNTPSDFEMVPKNWENLLHILDQHNENGRFHPPVSLEEDNKSSKGDDSSLREEPITLSVCNDENKEEVQAAHSHRNSIKSELETTIPAKLPVADQYVLSEIVNLAKDISHIFEIVDHLKRNNSTPEETKPASEKHVSLNEENNQTVLDETPAMQNTNIDKEEKSGIDEKGKITAVPEPVERGSRLIIRTYADDMKIFINQDTYYAKILRLRKLEVQGTKFKAKTASVGGGKEEGVPSTALALLSSGLYVLYEQVIMQQQQEIGILRRGLETLEGELKNVLQKMHVLEASPPKEDPPNSQDSNDINRVRWGEPMDSVPVQVYMLTSSHSEEEIEEEYEQLEEVLGGRGMLWISDDLLHAQNIIALNDDKIKFLEHEVENLNSENIELKHSLFGKNVEKLNVKKMMVAYCRELLLYILEMRKRYSGAVTLQNQEKVYSSHLTLLEEFTELNSYVKKLEAALFESIKKSNTENISEELKLISDDKLLVSIMGKMKICEDKLSKQREYISKLEDENILLEKQHELNKSRWEYREYELLKELGQLVDPESSMRDGIEDIAMNELHPKVENAPNSDSECSQQPLTSESQKFQVVHEKIDVMEKWKHDAEISAQKNVIKELIEQLAKAEFQLNERETELKEIKEEFSVHTSREIEKNSTEIINAKDYPAHLTKEPPIKDFSFAYKITMEALNVILNQKDAVLMRYKKQIFENREAQADTILESKVKHVIASVESSSERKDLNTGGQIQYQIIQEPKQAYKPPEVPFSEKIIELHNEVTLQQRKCDYLTVQLNLWESEAQRYRALSEKRQVELEEVLSRHINQQKSCLNPSCSFQVETPENRCFYGRKDILMDSAKEEPIGGMAAVDSPAQNKIMVDIGVNTEALANVSDRQRKLLNHDKELPGNKDDITIVNGSTENIDQELETLSNLINNAEEASDVKTEKKLVQESEHIPRTKLRHVAERKINQRVLQMTIEKLKAEKLEERLHNCQLQLESVTINAEKECKKRVDLAKWEEGKKWQQTVEKLQEKLKSEKKMVEDAKKLNSNLRDAIARLQREKTVLENKLRSFKKDKMTWNPDSEIQVEDMQKKILHLKKTIFDLEVVNISLKQNLDKCEREKKKARENDRDENKNKTTNDEEPRDSINSSSKTKHYRSKKGHDVDFIVSIV